MICVMDEAALDRFLQDEFPQATGDYRIDGLTEAGIRMVLPAAPRHVRPGGTIAGPAMFGLVDVSMYLAILARIGPQALAVTTNATIDFMRKPDAARDLVCECELLKLGRVLAVGSCLLYGAGIEAPVARASLTYSIPPKSMG
ncbi:MAG: PaaI family thioesterase [Pseudomonadota bacterium]